jgi:hypothetical protein
LGGAVAVVAVVAALVVAALEELDDEDPQPATASAALMTTPPNRASLRGPCIISFQTSFASQPMTPSGLIASHDHRDTTAGASTGALSSATVHFAELTGAEQRVLGSLIEKRWTTPDQYPLSLNALRLACNQSTNRDPVSDYDEATVRDAAQRLSRYGLVRLASGHGSRAVKYRHLAEEALSLGREQLAVLAALLLRGPQTPGELKARTERMVRLASLADVERVLDDLSKRGHARRMKRRAGQKEDRFEHTLGPDAQSTLSTEHRPTQSPSDSAPPRSITEASADGDLAARLDALEAEVLELREELAALRDSAVR